MALPNGKCLGPYEILAQLGAGGMGDVYRARDTRLGRIVALKVLREGTADAQSRSRFEREARAIAALKHPHICTVHDVGSDGGIEYLVIEYLEGETLTDRLQRGSMTIDEWLRCALEVAQALDCAHAERLVHRDLKPSNIMLTHAGAKLLDFGLAKMCSNRVSTRDETKSAELTRKGTVVGTPSYMAPEQLQGLDVDGRADVFAFGAVFYEALTGRRAFDGGSYAAISDAVLRARPPAIAELRPNVPTPLARIIDTCLAKDPNERWQSAHDIVVQLRDLNSDSAALKRPRDRARRIPSVRTIAAAVLLVLLIAATALFIARRGGPPIDRLAILPLRNASANPDADYLGVGISDSIINNLSQLPELHVVPRSLSSRFNGKTVNPEDAAHRLQARAILTGDVVERGDTIAISVELFDAQTKSRLWGGRYVRKFSDIFAVQEEIAREVSDKLRLRLTPRDIGKLRRRYTDDSEAYRLYLQGHYQYAKFSLSFSRTSPVVGALRSAMNFYREAIRRDSSYAPAYAGLASCYGVLVYQGAMPRAEGQREEEHYARKALSIDDSLAEAHAALAQTLGWNDHDWAGAERGYKRALDLDPQNGEIHAWYGLLLEVNGRFPEAEREARTAMSLDTTFPFANGVLVGVYSIVDCTRAELEARRILLHDGPSRVAYHLLADCAERQGRFSDAVEHYLRTMDLDGVDPKQMERFRTAFAAGGIKAFWGARLDFVKQQMAEGEQVPAFDRARYELKAQNYEASIDWLEKSVQAREGPVVWINASPVWDPLRKNMRFEAVRRKLGFR